MKRLLLTAVCGLVLSGSVFADVRTEEKAQVKFEGMLGRMVGIFGGRGAREGITTVVVVKGDRKSTTNGDNQQIVDLKEEKLYDIDLKDKSYRVTTFAQLRQQMEEARRKAAEQQPKEAAKPSEQPQQQMDMDFSLKDTGQRKTINGFDAHEVVMTITMREKGKTLEQSGGIVMTNSMWLAAPNPAQREIVDFDIRYAQKMALVIGLDAKQMAAMMAMYPQMQQAMAKMQAENVKLDGTTVLSDIKFETVASAEQAAQIAQAEKKDTPPPTSVTGLGGLIGRRIAGGNKDAAATPPAPSAPGHATLMTMHNELLTVTPQASDAEVSVPAGFKLKS
jgi:hypothetical protein